MSSDESFNEAALEALDDAEKMLQTILDSYGVTGNQCMEHVLTVPIVHPVSNTHLLGLAYCSLLYAKLELAKGKYKNFFIGLMGVTMIRPDNSDDKIKEMLSSFGKANAIKRHAETYATKKMLMDYWHEHIDPKLSNEKAADLLKKIEPLSHRKLSEYVAEAKRENIRLASKA